MQFVFKVGGVELDVDSSPGWAGSTVSDLLVSLESGGPGIGTVLVDGVCVQPTAVMSDSGIVQGSVVEVRSGPAAGTRPPAELGGMEFAIVGGPVSGSRVALTRAETTIGRSPSSDVVVNDLTVSPLHLRLRADEHEFQLEDLGSHNGTRVGTDPVRCPTKLWPGDLIRFGASEGIVRVTPADRPVGLGPVRGIVGGLISFNRPPRQAAPPAAGPIRVPDPPADGRRHVAFSAVSLLGPLVMGAVMVKLMGNVRYALFALMAPVMMITNVIATRRRNSKEDKSSAREFRAGLSRFCSELVAAADLERASREARCPDPAEIARRATLPSSRLWERRPFHEDYLKLRLGRAVVRWEPPVDDKRVDSHPDLVAAVEQASAIPVCPVEVDLAGGNIVGIVGDRSRSLSLARSLIVQATVLHGPADLAVFVMTDGARVRDWDWAKWLPHVRSTSGEGRLLSADAATSQQMMGALLAAAEESRGQVATNASRSKGAPTSLIVVDDESLTAGRQSLTRAALRGDAGPVAGIVLASSEDRLPAACSSVVYAIEDLGDAELRCPRQGTKLTGIVIAGIAEPIARRCAQALARYEDAEIVGPSSKVPESVGLFSVLDTSEPDALGLSESWRRAGEHPHPVTPIGIGENGPVELDLVSDGPHGLIGGTTGSGKSEFLRSFVAGLAIHSSPDHLVFVLVDYKGGSAFDACSRLPHTVGLVTDLDEHLGERALLSLEAELRRREVILRDAGAQDLAAYLKKGSPAGPMPRLVVVVDEFATMAAELPDFVGSLVGVAQRGRSLGMHLILATQRPAGVVDANIRANTNMRVALRMQDTHDSVDVIGLPSAVSIEKATPGRAYVRLGPHEVILVQTPLSGARTPDQRNPPPLVRPFRFGPLPQSAEHPSGAGPTDLERLVAACNEAFRISGMDKPRRPWLEMLDDHIPFDRLLGGVASSVDRVALAIADDPARQTQDVVSWDPAGGHLGLIGAVGSGTSTALITTALSAAATWPPDRLHIYGIDFGGGCLAPLEALRHVGAVVTSGERERLYRLVRLLAAEVVRRRDLGAAEREAEPRILLLVDGIAAMLSDNDGLDGQATLEAFTTILNEGPGSRASVALTGDRLSSVPSRLAGTIARRLMFSQIDPSDFSAIGVRQRGLPRFVAGRAIDSVDQRVVQVPWTDETSSRVDLILDRWPAVTHPPMVIDVMPSFVSASEVKGQGTRDAGPFEIPVGIAEDDRDVVSVRLREGEHLFVGGRSGSGVSTTLEMLTRMLAELDPETVRVAVAEATSPLRSEPSLFDAAGSVHDLRKVLEVAAHGDGRRWLVVVDDAHMINEPLALGGLLEFRRDCRVIAGGRADHLHGRLGHWTRLVRESGTGLLLQPRLDSDGDLLGVRLPRRLNVPLVPGRGFLVSAGSHRLVQVAGVDQASR